MISKDVCAITRETGSTGPLRQWPRKPGDRGQRLWDSRDWKQGKRARGQGVERAGEIQSKDLWASGNRCKCNAGGNVGAPCPEFRD
jgi:hypothetical protein